MEWPNSGQPSYCPVCKHPAQFCLATGVGQGCNWKHHPRGTSAVSHNLHVMHCLTCGMPVILHEYKRVKEIYPKRPTRDFAPQELDNSDISKDYNEAVRCEPESTQASIILLARCASQILVATKCAGMKKNDGLKDQFQAAIKTDVIRGPEVDEVRDLTETRNSVGHAWYDKEGNLLRVDDDDVHWWFEIVDWLIAQLYVNPAKAAERMARIRLKHSKKKEGDKV